jgi:tyramine---L-glutamate ligase
MRILILEHLCVNADDSNDGTLADEGFAMVRAACRDLAGLEGVEVRAAVHTRWKERAEAVGIPVLTAPSEATGLALIAATFDRVLLIAPEMDGIATRWAKLLEATGTNLLGPSSAFIAWASDKLAVARTLPAHSPPTMVWDGRSVPSDWGDELVLKPCDGVGALFTMIVRREALSTATDTIRADGYGGELIVQPYVRGRSVSVAAIGRDSGRAIVLPAVEQIIETVPVSKLYGVIRLKYRGGVVPIEGFADRARALTLSVMESAPPVRGWIGIDMILADDGRDVVVDVNPRLTTSYLGYSELFPGTAARLLIGLETNGDLEVLGDPSGRARFDVGGDVETVA